MRTRLLLTFIVLVGLLMSVSAFSIPVPDSAFDCDADNDADCICAAGRRPADPNCEYMGLAVGVEVDFSGGFCKCVPRLPESPFGEESEEPEFSPNPPFTVPQPEQPSQIFNLGDYTLRISESIKCPYFKNTAWITLLLSYPATDQMIIISDIVVDTGAFTTTLPIEVGKSLGIDVKGGEHVKFSTPTGSGEGWVHALKVGFIELGGGSTIDGHILGSNSNPYITEIPVLFYEGSSKVLGRAGLLNRLNLNFGQHFLTVTLPTD